MLFILLIILITSCAPKVEIDIAKPVEETPKSEPIEITKEEPKETIEEKLEEEISLEENTIEIKEDSFYPKEKAIEKNTEIEWIKKDVRDYKIACYLEGRRIIQSSNLKDGDSFIYTFLKEGEYTCITYPYGLRSTILVKAQQSLLSPTADVVRGTGENTKMASLAALITVAVVALLFFVYSRKRR